MKYIQTIALSTLFMGMMSLLGEYAFAQQPEPVEQTYALIGYGGIVFGLANVEVDGKHLSIDISTAYTPNANKEFEAWLVDDFFEGSGYSLSLGAINSNGTLKFDQNMMNPYTYTHLQVTSEPENDLDPLPAWSDTVGITMLVPPFGQ